MGKVKNLVICSTLNQITNYLIIKKYEPERIFNITFTKGIPFSKNVEPDKWDKRLKDVIKGYKITDIKLLDTDIYSIGEIKKRLDGLVAELKEEITYWHVTGGQRTIALAISEIIKENRKNDKLVYIEGNTEKLIVSSSDGDSTEDVYDFKNLNFDIALNLVGFHTKDLKSTNVLKKGKEKLANKQEYKFYTKLYNIICSRSEILNLDADKIKKNSNDKTYYKDTFRNLLLKSNIVCKKENINTNQTETRQKFIKILFEELIKEHQDLKDIGYYEEDISEIDKSYPAGYIFEKIVAYKIYDIIKDNPKIVRMETSLKTYFSKDENDNNKDNIIDEIDIILLTSTGKIINFECKSGGMEGDNAKSHKYTTYRLSGVFGMPILVSPLYEKEAIEKDLKKDVLKNSKQAYNAAKAAELDVCTIEKIVDGLKRLGFEKYN